MGISSIMDSSLFGKDSHALSKSDGVGDTSSMLCSVVQGQDLREVCGSGHTDV